MLFNHKFTSKLESRGWSATLDKHWPSILSQLSVSLGPGGDQRWWWISKSLRGIQKEAVGLILFLLSYFFFHWLRSGWNSNLHYWYLWHKKKLMACCSLIRWVFLFMNPASWNSQLMPPGSCCETLAAFTLMLLHASSLLLRNHCCGLLIVALLFSVMVWVVSASALASSWMDDKVLSLETAPVTPVCVYVSICV